MNNQLPSRQSNVSMRPRVDQIDNTQLSISNKYSENTHEMYICAYTPHIENA